MNIGESLQVAKPNMHGQTLRYRLAEKAMLGLLQGGRVEHRNAGAVARAAYAIADAMLKESEK